jgi:hypothetical protein
MAKLDRSFKIMGVIGRHARGGGRLDPYYWDPNAEYYAPEMVLTPPIRTSAIGKHHGGGFSHYMYPYPYYPYQYVVMNPVDKDKKDVILLGQHHHHGGHHRGGGGFYDWYAPYPYAPPVIFEPEETEEEKKKKKKITIFGKGGGQTHHYYYPPPGYYEQPRLYVQPTDTVELSRIPATTRPKYNGILGRLRRRNRIAMGKLRLKIK